MTDAAKQFSNAIALVACITAGAYLVQHGNIGTGITCLVYAGIALVVGLGRG